MDGTSTPGRGARRRPVVVAEELEKRRTRRMERRAAVRQRQARIDTAEKQYTEAWKDTKLAQNDLAAEIAVLERRIEEARSRTAAQIAEHRRQQALAAAAIRDERCGMDEVADILGISLNEARQLLSEARSLLQTGSAAVGDRQPREEDMAAESDPAAATRQDATANSEPNATHEAFESGCDEPDSNDGPAARTSIASSQRSIESDSARQW